MKEESIVKEAEEFASKNFSNKSSFEYHSQYSSYIAGRSKSIESEKAKDERIKEMNDEIWSLKKLIRDIYWGDVALPKSITPNGWEEFQTKQLINK